MKISESPAESGPSVQAQPVTGPEEQKIALEKQQLAAFAKLREDLGINKIELALAELSQTGKIQPVNDGKGDWKGLAQGVMGLIGDGIKQFGGSSGESPLMSMLMQDMVETNRMVKLIFSRAVAKSVGITLPEHKIT